jgi:hypothetical protein
MFKSGSIADELMHSMEKQLVVNQVEEQHKFNKLARAIDYLNAAANIFDKAGLNQESEDVINVIEDMSSKDASSDSWQDKMTGGLADKKKPKDFDSDALEKGIKVEMEHTNDRQVASEITMDHLSENPKYYDYLEDMEDKMEKEE